MMLHTFVFLAAGLYLAGSSTVSAGTPGKLLPRLQPYPNRAKRSLVDVYPRTLLQPATPALPAGAVINISLKHKRSNSNPLQPRAVTCQDAGYSVCPDQTMCCPVEGSCCASGDCCNNRFSCCPSGDCCPDGYQCATVDGQSGCCPNGQTCTAGIGQCADPTYVPCGGSANFCCPSGESCSTVNGVPTCAGSSSSGPGSSSQASSSATASQSAPAPEFVTASATNSSVASSAPPPPSVSTSVVVVVPTSTSSAANIPTTMSNAFGLSSVPTPTIVPFVGLTTPAVGIPTSGLNPVGNGATSERMGKGGLAAMFGASFIVVSAQVIVSLL